MNHEHKRVSRITYQAELTRLSDLQNKLEEDAYQLERALIYVSTQSVRAALIDQVREVRRRLAVIPELEGGQE